MSTDLEASESHGFDRDDLITMIASLDIIMSTIPSTDDFRAHTIRRIVNAGWGDSGAVNYWALTLMPLELLKLVESFIDLEDHCRSIGKPYSEGWGEIHRQHSARFINDLFNEKPLEQAVTAATNLCSIFPSTIHFSSPTAGRVLEHLKQGTGLDYQQHLNAEKLVQARTLLTVSSDLGVSGAKVYTDTIPFATQVLLDNELSFLIMSHCERYPEIRDFVQARSSLDPVTLRTMLESPATAVSSGIL